MPILCRTCTVYGEHAQFMVNMPNLWWTCSICVEHAQFVVNMLNFWWTSSIYGKYAQLMVNKLNLWWTCPIYGEHAQFTVNMLNLWWTCPVYSEHAQFMVNMLNLLSWLHWPWKTTPKWPFECQNPSTGSKDTVIFILKSADLYSHSWFDLTFGMALKNYPKMTLWTSKSAHWIKRYSDNYFDVSWFIQSQLILWQDWPWKTFPK